MPSKQKLPSTTPEDLKALGYTLFPCVAYVGPKDLDVWERESHHGMGWQYLVSLQSPAKGLRVLNADAPLDRVPDVGTLADMLLAAKILRKQPSFGFEWAIAFNNQNDFPGNFSAESFQDRAVDERILHEPFDEDDTITTFTIEANGDQDEDESYDCDVLYWLKSGCSKDLNVHVMGPLKFAIICNDPIGVDKAMKKPQKRKDLAMSHLRNPLHLCAWMGRDAIVPALVAGGHGPNAVNAQGDTPMHLAARQGHAAVCVALYKNGADPLIVNALGQTPLDMAEAAGQADSLHLLRTIGSSMVARAALHEILALPSLALKS